MVQPGVEGLGTPRTAIGDATFLDRQPDFDLSQELSFQSPSKDANIAQQLRNGNRPNLSTPRGSRAPFTNRRNVQANGNINVGGPEFTPLLKSATRNSARRLPGKENGRTTPNFLERIDEDITPLPKLNTSVYSSHTPLPNDATVSSTEVTTPITIRRRAGAKGPLDDGNQLSLREQENVVNKIEKENFGLKLKIHFLEEALRKAGPGFSEAALKENTELKVDK
ncbi:microtubule associated-domain-containing protein, partial [Sordaria brevicollis]